MPHSFSQVLVHLVFSTKQRAKVFTDKDLRKRVHAYLGNTCNHLQCHVIAVGGVEDHVHILCGLHRALPVAVLVRELKRDSSKWIKDQHPRLRRFSWQRGYGAFSVSPGHVQALIAYIDRQEEHHRQVTFQDEFRRLCRKYGIELDERYAWD